MIYLAYDGSLNGDWVSRYAIRFASHPAQGELRVVHVRDYSVPDALLEEKLSRIEGECRQRGVAFSTSLVKRGRDVFSPLAEAIPGGEESLVLCGTRVRSRRQVYLHGTVSEKLLRCGRFSVIAIRVVQPGLLGNPHDFLIPLAGHPRGFRTAWPFFRLFLPHVRNVFLLRGMAVSSVRYPHLSPERDRLHRNAGLRYLQEVREEIFREKGQVDFIIDNRVVTCEDWPREILVHASKLKAQMILLGASERSLTHRMVHGNPLERILKETPCDVGIYKGL